MKELSRELSRDYFFCYSQKVSNFLKEKNIPYITIAKDMNKNRVFSLYFKTEELQSALKEYSNR